MSDIPTSPADYKAIAFWGNQLRSFNSYIKQQQQRAFEEKAPVSALYRNTSRWVTVHEVQNQAVRKQAIKEGLM